jgi:hypothetical protein
MSRRLRAEQGRFGDGLAGQAQAFARPVQREGEERFEDAHGRMADRAASLAFGSGLPRLIFDGAVGGLSTSPASRKCNVIRSFPVESVAAEGRTYQNVLTNVLGPLSSRDGEPLRLIHGRKQVLRDVDIVEDHLPASMARNARREV